MGPRVCQIHLDPEISLTKVARCEIGDPTTTVQAPSETTADPVGAALAACQRCAEQGGPLLDWSERAAPTLEAALRLRREFDKDTERVFARLKSAPWMLSRHRQLSKRKLDLACVYACRPTETEAARKDCSRFAKVVRAAFAEGVVAETAADWLATKTLTDILAGDRQQGKRKTFAIRLPAASFPSLAALFTDTKTASTDGQIATIIQEAAARCEQILSKRQYERIRYERLPGR